MSGSLLLVVAGNAKKGQCSTVLGYLSETLRGSKSTLWARRVEASEFQLAYEECPGSHHFTNQVPMSKGITHLQPLQGVRALSCLSVAVFHINLLFASAASAWVWYDAWDRQPWISASSAGHAVYSLHFFMMMTGILSAAFLVPELQALAAQKPMIIRKYYMRRIKRIVPAFYIAVGLFSIIKMCPVTEVSHDALRMQQQFTGILRPRVTQLLFSTNITLDLVTYLPWLWNIPVQMQFYLLFPLILVGLAASKGHLRARLVPTCVLGIVASVLYKAWVTIYFDLPDPVPIFAYLDFVEGSGGHQPASVRAAFAWLNWLHSSFSSRVTDFSCGVLIYLIVSSPRATAALRRRPLVCGAVSAVCCLLGFVACFPRAVAPISLRPRPHMKTSIAQSLVSLVAVQGLLVPLSAAWLLVYILVQPGWPSRWLASLLGSKKWDWFAARSYSVFLLHAFVTLWLFELVPVTTVLGPLEEFRTYLVVCLSVLSIATMLAWLQDSLVSATISHWTQKPQSKVR
ncbi:hypothetical protein WJX84_007791 [Apatococcus fuscideae]|uniref:Acyltransferase 3 domain-containing protein n=1 Tax=Apatococcus fuscideae TaxID=2026836 RepID=A0AAW1TC69_9CHLO